MRRTIVLACASAALTAGLAPGAAGAATGVGHSGWYWGNPLPQGSALAAVDFSGATGYAVGTFGAAIRSSDGGATWTGLPSGLTSDLTTVDAISADSVAIGGGCALRRSDDGGRTFRRLPWTASDSRCSSPVREVEFPASAVGYLQLADRTVLRTADGGRTWSRRTAPPDGAGSPITSVTDTAFTTASDGVALGRDGSILRTTDGAATWAPATQPAGTQALAFDFPTALVGYAIGATYAGPGLVKTTDGGATWTAVPGLPAGQLFNTIRCSDADTCLVVGGNTVGSTVIRLTGGGTTLTPVSAIPDGVFQYGGLAAAGASRLVAIGPGSRILASPDLGTTWTPVSRQLTGIYRTLVATSATDAEAFGPSGALARTTDGGQTWLAAGVPSTADIVSVSFPDAVNGFVLNAAGDLFATDNGATSWQSLDAGADDVRAVLALDARRVLLVGPTGVKRSVNGGAVFDPVTSGPVAQATLTAADRAGAAVVAYGPGTAAVSTDGGRRWTALKRPSRSSIRRLDFATARRGVVLDGAGRLWRTTDGGRHWAELLATGTALVREVAFGDASRGFAALDRFGSDRSGYVLRTSDGGASFTPQLVSKQAIGAGQLASGGASGGVALDAGGRLFGTVTGGSLPQASTLTLKAGSRSLTRSQLRRARGRVTVTGRLSAAQGGETILVSARRVSGGTWRQAAARVTSAGTFTATFSVSASTAFVAQWRGDDARNGDGTPALVVRVR